ncbi:MAG: hypothetical protein QOE11_1072, partial [Solirubrobacteraceae bacterium]|nr:hypothetical protein [Solirubrobacteraceae bacterium]
MRRLRSWRAAVALGLLACACVAAALALVPRGGDDGRGAPPLRLAPPPGRAPLLTQEPALRPRAPFGAQLAQRTQLRARPGGRIVHVLGMRTGYGSARVLSVVARRGRWLGVLSHYLPNARAGWIPAASATLLHEPYTLHVDLSRRMLVVRHEGRPVRRIVVAVGRAANATPTGRFAVTDRLRIGGPPGPYGCCALALTARQPHVPQGWSGGD